MAAPVITINLWGKTIGYLGYAPGQNEITTFEYAPEFATSNIQLSPLEMKYPPMIHSFPTISQRTFHGLPGIFADSLPDKFGNKLIDRFFADKGLSASDITALDRLAYIGKRSMGAFEYEPSTNDTMAMDGGSLNIHHLNELANMVLREKSDFNLKLSTASHEEMLALIRVGSSAGGARSKALVAQDAQGRFYDGTLDAGADKRYWLLKFDSDDNSDKDRKDPKGMTRIEYIYSLIAKECGIDIPSTTYITEGDDFHFMIERFDREIIDGKVRKKHYASWAGLRHFDRDHVGVYSYEQLVMTCRELGLGQNELNELFRRAVFNIIGRNQDDHAKNFGFMMDRNGAWSFSPAFDMTYAYDPLGKWTKEHQISLSGKRDHFSRSDLLAFASKCSIPVKHANEIIDKSLEAFSSFERLAKEFEVPDELCKQAVLSLRINNL